jgi:predicted GNAT family acetyltransferase
MVRGEGASLPSATSERVRGIQEEDIRMAEEITYRTNLDDVDWAALNAAYAADDFDNGRTDEQLQASFENSYSAVIAYAGDRIIGTARALSDGICNAYVVDVWTLTPYRRRGIARRMMALVTDPLRGQHVYLFTEPETVPFYRELGYQKQGVGLSKVIGAWLQNDP